ncbi:MAG: putative N6-adenine-specific DNA methylase [Algoriphagus sp.]|jgi:putative N6-adenine-specific DNA methylase
MENYQMVAKTLAGLENVLFAEIEALGGLNIEKRKRAVIFEGEDSLMIKSNLCLRTAISILVPIFEFKASDEFELYNQIYAVQWEEIFGVNDTFAITATVSGTLFTHSQYVALKTKDAMVDRFRKKFGKRPSVDVSDADYQFNIHIQYDSCTISLNSSGDSLNRRGYRINSNEAPLNEVLAAGIILKSGWNKQDDFYDPMSGSGTFGIEAALLAHNIAPGLNRSFGFQRWSDFNRDLFKEIHQEVKNQISPNKVNIFCRDLLTENLEYIAKNSEEINVQQYIDIQREDFFHSSKIGEQGYLFFNPPYGERLEIDEINSFYKKIGDQLKQNYSNCEAWIISSNLDALKFFGLKPESKHQMFNGGLECKLNHYKLY